MIIGSRAVYAAFATLATAAQLLGLIDVVFAANFPIFSRLSYGFSASYLNRELFSLKDQQGTVVLGDSTLWGYGVAPEYAAISLVRAKRHEWVNLADPGGGPVHTLALIHLLLSSKVHPRAIVFNVNEKQFNPSDSAFKRLYPAVEQLAWPIMPSADRSRLTRSLSQTIDAQIDRRLGLIWRLYGMRADIRDALFHDVDAAHALQNIVEAASGTATAIAQEHRPIPDNFEGTYDLTPLSGENASYQALIESAQLLRARGIAAYAILSPTNHRLLHDFIDVPEYESNLETVRKKLESLGVTVLNFDRSIQPDEFIDNDHLTISGNKQLAILLESQVR